MRSLASIGDELRVPADDIRHALSLHPDMDLDDYLCNQAMEGYYIEKLKKYLETTQENVQK